MFCLERTQLRVLRIDCPEDPLRPEEVGRGGGSRVKSVREVSDSEFAREMARREIIYQRPTPYWQNGLSIGNGDVGGSVFGGGPESDGLIGIALNKVDVWDERYDRKGHHVHTLAELRALVAEHAGTEEGRKYLNSLEPYGLVAEPGWFSKTYPYPYSPPTCKPTGVVRIDPGAAFERLESRLSIHRGEVTFTLGDGDKSAEVAACSPSSVCSTSCPRWWNWPGRNFRARPRAGTRSTAEAWCRCFGARITRRGLKTPPYLHVGMGLQAHPNTGPTASTASTMARSGAINRREWYAPRGGSTSIIHTTWMNCTTSGTTRAS
jgi:hypothetical protein